MSVSVNPLIQGLIRNYIFVICHLSYFSYLSSRSQPITFHFTVSRLAGMDQAIHKLNVGHYTLDVKVSQLLDRLSSIDGKTIISIPMASSFY